MRLRLAVATAMLCIVGLFVLEMSGRAPRLASTNHVDFLGFVATVPPHGTICQPATVLPADTGAARVFVGTYSHPAPMIRLTFREGTRAVTSGGLRAGAPQGYLDVPFAYPHGATRVGTLCLHFEGPNQVALGGASAPAGDGSEQVDGQPAPGIVALAFMRPSRESWWQLLPTLDQRVGFGKASIFGNWTLPFAACLLLIVWAASIRLLLRETSQ